MTTDIDNFSNDLDSYILKRYGYKKSVCHVTNLRNIHVLRTKIRLTLRFKPVTNFFRENSLVVANIEFNKLRKGEGTSLLKFFVGVADKYNIKHIAFEQVRTELCDNFTEKWGFAAIYDLTYNDKHRTIPVDTLRKNLNAATC